MHKQPLTPNSRRSILKTTWAIIKETGISFGLALKQAWAAFKTKLALESTDEKGRWIDFIKGDGTTRHALATRTMKHIPAYQHPFGQKPETNPLVVTFYDLLISDWRSFRVDRLIIA